LPKLPRHRPPRVGVFELLMVDDPVRSKIQDRSNASEIRDVGLTRDIGRLRDDSVAKIRQGLTKVEEVSRVTVRAAKRAIRNTAAHSG
jgi:type II secretory ATPase GspE/PulE/Tfp pilus assembly ATPase PilB-like protein